MGFFGDLFNRRVAERDPASGEVSYSKWHLEGRTLSCGYIFNGLSPPETTVSLRIECHVSRQGNGRLLPYVDFVFRPSRFLQPFFREPLDPEGGMTQAPFHVGLVSSKAGRGTERSPLVQGGVFTVSAYLWDARQAMKSGVQTVK